MFLYFFFFYMHKIKKGIQHKGVDLKNEKTKFNR